MFENTNYRGNANIKKTGVQMQITPEQQIEWLKCADDPVYFSRKYVKIVNIDEGIVSFDLYDYQEEIIQSYLDHKRTIVNTSRQVGKTTTAVALILHFILFNQHKIVGILANKGDTARGILGRIQLSYERLPKWLQQGVVEWNKGNVELENGCKCIAGATSSDSMRSNSLNFIYIDECAFISNFDEFYQSVYPTISSGKKTKILFTSTPNGLNHFYQFWVGGGKKDKEWNGFNPIEVKWDRVPGRDAAWAADALAALNGDVSKFDQEFNCSFIGSSGTLISGKKLKTLLPMVPLREDDNGLKQYVEYKKDNTYVMVADVSRGKGLDYHAASMIDVTNLPYQQVMTFRSNTINTVDYSEILFRMSKIYGEAEILIEINDLGQQVADILFMDFEHEGIIMTSNNGRSGKTISPFGKNPDRGIRTTSPVKNTGCAMLKMILEQNKLIINDLDTINELNVFSRKRNTYCAEQGKHDDLVMGLVLFSWMVDQQYFRDVTNMDFVNEMREQNLIEMEQNMLPFGFIMDGKEEEDEIIFSGDGLDRWITSPTF